MTATEFGVGPTVTTSDGVDIATYDLGGDGPPLILVHATGFHGRVWFPVAALLRERYRCIAFDARGHGASGKAPGGNYDWAGFGYDVVAVATGLLHPGAGPRPRAVGHSCGGAALLLAEEAEPGTFEALYCYEPVTSDWAAIDAAASDAVTGNPLADGARRRRPVFASRAAALENFAHKAAFAGFDPAALAAYVEWGFVDRPDGTVELACRPEDEARVYEMAPGNRSFQQLDRVACPVTLAGGGRHAHFGRPFLTAVAARIGPPTTIEIHDELGHFGPLQRPAQVASSILAAFTPDSESTAGSTGAGSAGGGGDGPGGSASGGGGDGPGGSAGGG